MTTFLDQRSKRAVLNVSEFFIPNVLISGYVNTESIWSLQTYVCLKKNLNAPRPSDYLDFRAFFSCVFVFICYLLLLLLLF